MLLSQLREDDFVTSILLIRSNQTNKSLQEKRLTLLTQPSVILGLLKNQDEKNKLPYLLKLIQVYFTLQGTQICVISNATSEIKNIDKLQ